MVFVVAEPDSFAAVSVGCDDAFVFVECAEDVLLEEEALLEDDLADEVLDDCAFD